MSDDVVGQVQSMMEAGTAPSESAPVESQQVASPVESQPNYEQDYGFLKNVDPTERPILEKYLKSIDGNITRRFQDIHAQYAPYKELGDVEQLKQYANLVQQMQTVEWQWQAYNALKNQFASIEQQQLAQQQQNELDPYAQQQVQQPVVPPEVQIKLQQLEQVVLAQHQQRVAEQQAAKQAQEDAQFEQYLGNLHAEYGNFDDNWVVTAAYANGGNLVAAVQAWKQYEQSIINQASQASTAPPVISGGQVAPPQTPKLGDLSSNDIKSLTIQALTHLQRNS